jgi:hypothetical protein
MSLIRPDLETVQKQLFQVLSDAQEKLAQTAKEQLNDTEGCNGLALRLLRIAVSTNEDLAKKQKDNYKSIVEACRAKSEVLQQTTSTTSTLPPIVSIEQLNALVWRLNYMIFTCIAPCFGPLPSDDQVRRLLGPTVIDPIREPIDDILKQLPTVDFVFRIGRLVESRLSAVQAQLAGPHDRTYRTIYDQQLLIVASSTLPLATRLWLSRTMYEDTPGFAPSVLPVLVDNSKQRLEFKSRVGQAAPLFEASLGIADVSMRPAAAANFTLTVVPALLPSSDMMDTFANASWFISFALNAGAAVQATSWPSLITIHQRDKRFLNRWIGFIAFPVCALTTNIEQKTMQKTMSVAQKTTSDEAIKRIVKQVYDRFDLPVSLWSTELATPFVAIRAQQTTLIQSATNDIRAFRVTFRFGAYSTLENSARLGAMFVSWIQTSESIQTLLRDLPDQWWQQMTRVVTLFV